MKKVILFALCCLNLSTLAMRRGQSNAQEFEAAFYRGNIQKLGELLQTQAGQLHAQQMLYNAAAVSNQAMVNLFKAGFDPSTVRYGPNQDTALTVLIDSGFATPELVSELVRHGVPVQNSDLEITLQIIEHNPQARDQYERILDVLYKNK